MSPGCSWSPRTKHPRAPSPRWVCKVTEPPVSPSPHCSPPPPHMGLLFPIQTDYSPEHGDWGRDGSKQALRRHERKFETHVCCLDSGNPEPSARVAQRCPLPPCPHPCLSDGPALHVQPLSASRQKLPGPPGPEELETGIHPQPQSLCVSAGGAESHGLSLAVWG